ncbi:MAG: alpha/beta fold hydrolase [Oscillospiraceae bacterium]|nr:alpha/beta fold hydrolase [Oscillospiraceae bacterium]
MTEEKIIVGEGTEFPLNGILTVPENCGKKVPAVVFVHGSGSSNMDEKVMKLTPFKDLAKGLAKRGIASVRYDKRSFAHGRKMLKKGSLTVREEVIEDAVLASKLLKMDSRIDPEKVFIIGHSMGAMLAPRIDAEGGDFCGLILMAGTLDTLEGVLFRQLEEMKNGKSKIMAWVASMQDKKFRKSFEHLYEISDEEAKKRKYAGGVDLYYFKEMGKHRAAEYLEKTEKPVLIMQGSRDLQVDFEKDFGGYKRLFGERKNFSFGLYEGLNHCFVPALYDDISKATKEFSVERHIGEEVISDIAGWILENSGETEK